MRPADAGAGGDGGEAWARGDFAARRCRETGNGRAQGVGASVEAMSRLAEDRPLLARLGRAARARATELTWDRFAEAVLTRLAPAHFPLACSGPSC